MDQKPCDSINSFVPFEYPICKKLRLSRGGIPENNIEFIDVLKKRRSIIPTQAATLNELAQVLQICTKIYSIGPDEHGYYISKRATPSAGARHPVDLLVSQPNPAGVRTLDYYNPVDHSLGKLELNSSALAEFLDSVSANVMIDGSSLIWFAIQTNKTASKYSNPESLYWKDLGALLFCIQLVATYIGLNSCPLGTLASIPFNMLFHTDCLKSGGGIILGK